MSLRAKGWCGVAQRGIPLIYLHNVTGFMVGKQYEREGMLKWGSQARTRAARPPSRSV
jgi:3-methylcrotonyl-CoA carboxylase beta subunit